MVKKNGQISNEQQAAFLAAGYEPKHPLEALVGIAQKNLANFTKNLEQAHLDDFAYKFVWTPSVTSGEKNAL